MNLSKSKYCNGLQCKKMLWLNKYKPEEKEQLDNDSVLENGNNVHEVARKLLGEDINIKFNEDLSQMIKDTEKALKNDNVIITEASFNYKNNFCSVDILKKENDKYEIYEVKSSTKLKDVYIDDASYQYYVLTSLGFNVEKCYVVILNDKYVKKGKLDLNKLFTKNDVTEDVIMKQDEVKKNIEDINKYMETEDEPNDDIGKKCFQPYECPFFKYCTRHLPESNIFDINEINVNKKFELYKEGILSLEDLLKADVSSAAKQHIEYELYDKEDYIDKESIKEFLNTLSEPLYFLDFETFAFPIPKYDGTRPYQQVPFQYSLHYLEDGKLHHKEFLAESGIDPRRLIAESLVRDIPKNVPVLAYYMSFERGRIEELAEIFPDLKDHLMSIHDNIKDLIVPFKNRSYYAKGMHGSASIKYVLPAMFPNDENLNYSNLELVHNGDEAMNIYARLDEYPKEEQEYIRESLLKYCGLDTYAMVKIYEKLMEVVK